jgi:hypothetical protein
MRQRKTNLELSTRRVEEVDCRRMAIYGPMLYTALYVMLLIQSDTRTLRGQVGGSWALEIKTFFGTCEIASSGKACAIWGPKKSSFPGPHPSYLPK